MNIKTVTVLGANGTMGRNVSAIFASFGDAKVYMVCRNMNDAISAKEMATKSVRAEVIGKNLIAKTYDDLKKCVTESDLIFESVSESYKVKNEVLKTISEYLPQKTVIGTGTSGFSINTLSQNLTDDQRKRFMGIHMYNPPYNMRLCEVIPSDYTDADILSDSKEYLENVLDRQVVEIKDEAAFMGNRIGFQFINKALQLAEEYADKGGIDYIDAIFKGYTGRAMAPLITSDFVGLDVHKAIVDNVYENTNDFAHDDFVLPQYAEDLISDNKLGRKTGAGLYRKSLDDNGNKVYEVYDIETKAYRRVKKYSFAYIAEINKNIACGNYKQAMDILINDKSRESAICIKMLLLYILYSVDLSDKIGDNIFSADYVMSTGFNWIPPLALANLMELVKPFKEIVYEKFDKEYLESIDADAIINKIEPSQLDFRPFIKAK